MSCKFYQQGDVLLKKVTKLPKGLKRLKTNVLAEGETTGHFHAVVPRETEHRRLDTFPGFKLLQAENGDRYIQLTEPAEVKHQEHHTIQLDPGLYQIDLVREFEYDANETRRVVD